MERRRLHLASSAAAVAGSVALCFVLAMQARWLARARSEKAARDAAPAANEAEAFQANSRAAVAEQRCAALEKEIALSETARVTLEARVVELMQTSSGLVILSDADVRALLPVAEARAVQRAAFAAQAQGKVTAPPRIIIPAPQHDGCTLFKPAAIVQSGDASDELGIKVVAVRPRNAPPQATIPATVLVLNEVTGVVVAVIDATFLTAQRTAAGSAVATELLLAGSNTPPVELLVFGAGLQAAAHVEALLDLYPSLASLSVVNRSAPRAEALLASPPCVALHRTAFIASADRAAVAAAVARADVVVTATNACEPLFTGTALKPGAHVIAVGCYTAAARELDAACVARCAIVVDEPEAWKVGDLAQLSASQKKDRDCGTLGELVVNGGSIASPPAAKEADCTLFKSVGVAFQDVAAGAAVLRAFRRRQSEIV